jgi:hypothetical protein
MTTDDATRKARIARWKDKLKLSINDDGNVLFGWGYPQSVHMGTVNRLNANPSKNVDLDEVFEFLDKEIGESQIKK